MKHWYYKTIINDNQDEIKHYDFESLHQLHEDTSRSKCLGLCVTVYDCILFLTLLLVFLCATSILVCIISLYRANFHLLDVMSTSFCTNVQFSVRTVCAVLLQLFLGKCPVWCFASYVTLHLATLLSVHAHPSMSCKASHDIAQLQYFIWSSTQTDIQTDRQTDRQTGYTLASSVPWLTL